MTKDFAILQHAHTAFLVWFPEETCTVFQVARIHARMIKFPQKNFIESILFEKVNPTQRGSSKFKNIHDIENKLTRFRIYHETEFACNYKNPLYKTQFSERLVEYVTGFDMTTGEIKFDPYAALHLINEDTSYIPVNLRKSAGNPLWKTRTIRQ